MTIEDVEWLLRYPCDTMAMDQETLNEMGSAIAAGNRPGVGVVYTTTYDGAQRPRRTPESIAGKKLIVLASSGEHAIYLSVRGIVEATIRFAV